MRHSGNFNRPNSEPGGEQNGEDTTWKSRYDRISASLSLITDSSVEVRRAAATQITQCAAEVQSLPHELIAALLKESDATATGTLIDSLPRMRCPTERSVPALIALLNDSREQVAIASAQALGALGNFARGVFIPMAILSRGAFSPSNDPRVTAFERSLSDSGLAEYTKLRGYVENQLSDGIKPLRTRLRGALVSPPVSPDESLTQLVVIALCLGSESTRSLASNVLINLRRCVCADPRSLSLVEGALAFTANQIERTDVSNCEKLEFFEVCRETRLASGLEYVIASLRISRDPRLESTRDFTTVYISEGDLCESTVHRMCQELWGFDSEMVCVAATNLGALVDRLPPDIAQHVVTSLFNTLVIRAEEGARLTSALVAGILYLRRFEAEVVEHCERLVAAKLGTNVDRVVEDIMEDFSVYDPEYKRRALGIRQYLASH